MWTLLIRKGISRRHLFEVLLGLEEGQHVKYPEAEMVPVTEFKLEPLAEKGIMLVDGERIDSGAIQAKILPSFANILYT